jgi:thioredoxin 1
MKQISNNNITKHVITEIEHRDKFFSILKNLNPGLFIIKLGASWCGPCSKLDKDYLVGLSDKIKWYKCDIDENKYSPGYCGVKTIPAFLAIVNGSVKPLFGSSDTMKVAEWMKGGF